MKARFATKQPAVRWQPLDDGMVDVTICLNGQEIAEKNAQMVDKEQCITATGTYWEYDFHQFRERADNITREDVEGNPEKYLDYTPSQPKSLEEQAQEQAETISMLTECLLEVSELVYV